MLDRPVLTLLIEAFAVDVYLDDEFELIVVGHAMRTVVLILSLRILSGLSLEASRLRAYWPRRS